MQRDRLFVDEMIEAAARIVELVGDKDPDQLALDQTKTEALSWNFMVLGEAASQISAETKSLYGHVDWSGPIRLRNTVVHRY